MSTQRRDDQEHDNNKTNMMSTTGQDTPQVASAKRRLEGVLSPEQLQQLQLGGFRPDQLQVILALLDHNDGSDSDGKRHKRDVEVSFHTPSQNSHPPPRRRSDLSEKYLTRDGQTPVELLNDELNAIIEEHTLARKEYPQASHYAVDTAPLICLVQSSGFGKTRAVLELAKTKKRLVYLLCKDHPEAWQVPNILQKVLWNMDDAEEHVCEREWTKFLSAVKKCAGQDKYNTTEQLYNAQIQEDGAFGEFYVDLEGQWKAEMAPIKSPQRSALKRRRNDSQSSQSSSSSSSLSAAAAAAAAAAASQQFQSSDAKSSTSSESSPLKKKRVVFNDSGSSNDITNESLVVCFDEVTGLEENSLRALRRSAEQAGILAIFVDNAPSICKVLYSIDHPAKKKGRKSLGRLVTTVFSLNTMDLNWDHDENKYDDYQHLFCAGRPRWKSHIDMCKTEGKTPEDSIGSLLDLATNLLVKAAGAFLENEDLHVLKVNDSAFDEGILSPGQIALFSCRFSLGPRSKISHILIKHSLATLIGVSEDKSIVGSTYAPEPVLAEASARYTKDKNNLRRVLKHVKAAFHSDIGMLEPPRGDLGEMCAAALLGYAMDHIRQTKNHKYMSETVKLKDLLVLFNYGSISFEGGETIRVVVKDWNVNFTHFVQPQWTPTQADLPVMWSRRMAYYVPDEVRGLDLLIAIQNNDSKYGTLRVKVKNYTNIIIKSECSKILKRLLPSKCPPHIDNECFSVGLLLSVNAIDECWHLLSRPDQKSRYLPNNQQGLGGKEKPPKNLALQLATRFPCHQDSPLKWLTDELRDICSQNTFNEIGDDWDWEERINQAVKKVNDQLESGP